MLAAFPGASIALLGAAPVGEPRELRLGDPAPRLEIKEFVRSAAEKVGAGQDLRCRVP